MNNPARVGVGIGLALGLLVVVASVTILGTAASGGPVQIRGVGWTKVWTEPNNSTAYSFPTVWGSCFNLTGEYNSSAKTSCYFVSQSPIQSGQNGSAPKSVEIGSVSVTPPFAIDSVSPDGAPCVNCQEILVVLVLPSSPGSYGIVGELHIALLSP
jgi:hypothetical protein